MSVEIFFASIVLTALLAGCLAAYAWGRGEVPGARAYMVLSASEALLAMAEALSMLAADAGRAVMWWNLRFLFTAAMPVAWLAFGLEYSGRHEWRSRRLLTLASIPPLITQVVLWTNGLHGLWVRQEVGFWPVGAFLLAVTAERIPGPWFLIHTFYGLLLTLTGMAFLLVPAWRQARQHLAQTILLTAGALIAIVASVIPIFDLLPGVAFNVFIPGLGLSVAIIAVAAFRFGFLRRAPEAIGVGGAREEKRSLALFLLVLVLMTSGLAGIGYYSYSAYERQYRLQVERQLSAIADLKVGELEGWRFERLADAHMLSDNAWLASLVRSVLEAGADGAAARSLRTWLDSLRDAYGYESVLVLDAEGQERLTVPPATTPSPAHLVPDARAVLASGNPEMLDFHRDEDGVIHLAVLAPIYSASPERRPLGVVVLRIDPSSYFYPYLQRWPGASETAETLLFRREGDGIIYLNPLRFRPDAPLSLRLPLDRTDVLAVRGLLGERGMIEAVDYRGQPVVGEVRPVPDTPWYLVVRMDLDEVYAPLRARLWETIGIFGSLMIASAAGLWMAWRRQQVGFHQERVEAAEALRASEEKFRTAFEISPDAITITRLSDGVIVAANEGFSRLSGHRVDEAIGKSSLEIPLWDDAQDRARVVEGIRKHGRVENYEARFRTGSGRTLDGLMSGALIELGGEPHILSTTRDITERRRSERELQRLNRMYALISQVNQAFVHLDDSQALLDEICRVAIDFGGFRMAWICLLEGDRQVIRPRAWAGFEDGYLTTHEPVRLTDVPEGQGPTGTALRQGRTIVCDDIASEASMAPWREAALARGYRSSIAVPIHLHGQTAGTFNLYASEPAFFSPAEVQLLEEVAAEIGYALEALESARERSESAAALRASEARYRLIAENSSDVIWTMDNDLRFTYISPSIVRLRGLTPEEAMAEPVEQTMPPESAALVARMLASLHSLEEAGERVDDVRPFEIQQFHRDGTLRWVEIQAQVLRDSEGVRRGFLGITRDIGERKQSEGELRRLSSRNEAILAAVPDIIAEVDTNKIYTWVNQAGREFFGEDVVGREAAFYFEGEQDTYETVRPLFAGAEEAFYVQSWQRRRDGQKRLLGWWCRVLKDADGNVTGALSTARDITESNRAQEALRQSEARFRTLVEQAPSAIFVQTRGTFAYMNPQALRLFGAIDERQMLGRPVPESFDPEYRAQVRERIARLNVERRPVPQAEEVILRLDGRRVDVEVSAVPFTLGGEDGALVFLHDLTERRQAEAATRLANARLQRFRDANIVGVVIAAPNGQVLEANDYYLDTIGYTRREFEEGLVDWRALTPPEWLLADERAIEELRQRGVCTPYEKEYLRRDGRRVSVYTSDAMLPGPDEHIAAFVLDITARKMAEQEQQQYLEFLRALQETTLELLAPMDEDVLLENIVRRAGALVGTTAGYLDLVDPAGGAMQPRVAIGALSDSMNHPATLGQGVAGVVWQTGAPLIVEDYDAWPLRLPGMSRGAVGPVVGVPLLSGGKVLGVIGLGHERTSGKAFSAADLDLLAQFARLAALAIERAGLLATLQAERDSLAERVRERTADLEAANRGLEAFAYSVSHDLRAPLRAMEGFSSALLGHYRDQLDEQGQHFLTRIQEASLHMGRLINDMLDLSRITRAEFTAQPVDLSRVAREVADGIRSRNPKRKARITIADGMTARGDARLLRIALENLLENAWKFTGGRPSATIEVGWMTPADFQSMAGTWTGHVGLSERPNPSTPVYFVRDSGAGFDMAYAEKLFAPFQRMHTQSEFPGTGIGLAIVQRVIARHGGQIWAHARVDEGATFCFTLGGRREEQDHPAGRRQPGRRGTDAARLAREQHPE